nr:MAG TPA: hypothetical protein [Crassvirales sp.]
MVLNMRFVNLIKDSRLNKSTIFFPINKNITLM